MKEVKQAKKWIENANKINKLHAKQNRLTSVVRIREDFTNREQHMYPLQFPISLKKNHSTFLNHINN